VLGHVRKRDPQPALVLLEHVGEAGALAVEHGSALIQARSSRLGAPMPADAMLILPGLALAASERHHEREMQVGARLRPQI
jgi:hypothetical protein